MAQYSAVQYKMGWDGMGWDGTGQRALDRGLGIWSFVYDRVCFVVVGYIHYLISMVYVGILEMSWC